MKSDASNITSHLPCEAICFISLGFSPETDKNLCGFNSSSWQWILVPIFIAEHYVGIEDVIFSAKQTRRSVVTRQHSVCYIVDDWLHCRISINECNYWTLNEVKSIFLIVVLLNTFFVMHSAIAGRRELFLGLLVDCTHQQTRTSQQLPRCLGRKQTRRPDCAAGAECGMARNFAPFSCTISSDLLSPSFFGRMLIHLSKSVAVL